MQQVQGGVSAGKRDAAEVQGGGQRREAGCSRCRGGQCREGLNAPSSRCLAPLVIYGDGPLAAESPHPRPCRLLGHGNSHVALYALCIVAVALGYAALGLLDVGRLMGFRWALINYY